MKETNLAGLVRAVQTVDSLQNHEQLQSEQKTLQECSTTISSNQSRELTNSNESLRKAIVQEESLTRTKLLLNEFRATWGSKWLSPIAELDYLHVVALWNEEVGSLEDDDLRRALLACRSSFEFPPSISQFLRIAYDFYSESTAFNIALNNKLEEIEKNYEPVPKNLVIYHAKRKALHIFNTRNEYSGQEQRREWKQAYNDEIMEFLKSRNEEC